MSMDLRFLMQAVDEGLGMLGEPARKIIYRKLERDFRICPADIPVKFEQFSWALKEIFGPGADVLIRLIVERRAHTERLFGGGDLPVISGNHRRSDSIKQSKETVTANA